MSAPDPQSRRDDRDQGAAVDALAEDLQAVFAAAIAHAIVERGLSPAYVLQAATRVTGSIAAMLTGDRRDAAGFLKVQGRAMADADRGKGGALTPAMKASNALAVRIHDAYNAGGHVFENVASIGDVPGARLRDILARDLVHGLTDDRRYLLAIGPERPDGEIRTGDVVLADNTASLNQKAGLATAINVDLVEAGARLSKSGGRA